ncbi:hypothetical protein [Egicoccus sp. AB-alg6-2]|uniref:hypothetical protein n=1 Tax=Egicoccus sp. AB-alg6-2 TaxID=3242692 RepID=UPI00359E2F61
MTDHDPLDELTGPQDDPRVEVVLCTIADRLQAPPDEMTARRHRRAIVAELPLGPVGILRRSGIAGVAAAVAVFALALGGLLPAPVQQVAADAAARVGILLPRPTAEVPPGPAPTAPGRATERTDVDPPEGAGNDRATVEHDPASGPARSPSRAADGPSGPPAEVPSGQADLPAGSRTRPGDRPPAADPHDAGRSAQTNRPRPEGTSESRPERPPTPAPDRRPAAPPVPPGAGPDASGSGAPDASGSAGRGPAFDAGDRPEAAGRADASPPADGNQGGQVSSAPAPEGNRRFMTTRAGSARGDDVTPPDAAEGR